MSTQVWMGKGFVPITRSLGVLLNRKDILKETVCCDFCLKIDLEEGRKERRSVRLGEKSTEGRFYWIVGVIGKTSAF